MEGDAGAGRLNQSACDGNLARRLVLNHAIRT